MPFKVRGLVQRQVSSFARYALATLTVFVLTLSVMTMLAGDAFALRITMKRVIFEGPKRAELLTIVNNSGEEVAYRLGWRRMRMTETQSLQTVKDEDPAPDLMLAEDMIRYAPRRVVLPPGASQQIRLMLRRPKDLPDGEYRSHFWVQPEAPAVKFDPNAQKTGPKGSSVQVKMLTGMTLPVFVRSGKMEAKGTITDAKLAAGGKEGLEVSFTINREGNRSLYGDVELSCVGGTEKDVKVIRGIAVYTEVKRRMVKFDMPLPEAGASACRQVNIKYTAPDDDALFNGGMISQAVAG